LSCPVFGASFSGAVLEGGDLSPAHFLHQWWIDDGRWSSTLLGRKAAFPFTMLLTDCAPVQTAMDQPKIALGSPGGEEEQ